MKRSLFPSPCHLARGRGKKGGEGPIQGSSLCASLRSSSSSRTLLALDPLTGRRHTLLVAFPLLTIALLLVLLLLLLGFLSPNHKTHKKMDIATHRLKAALPSLPQLTRMEAKSPTRNPTHPRFFSLSSLSRPTSPYTRSNHI